MRTPRHYVKSYSRRSRLPNWVVEAGIWLGCLAGALVLVALLSGISSLFVSDSKAIEAAKNNGFTDITVLHKDWFLVSLRGCDKNDTTRFTVRGTNVRGEVRVFYVCAAPFKGGTIRSK